MALNGPDGDLNLSMPSTFLNLNEEMMTIDDHSDDY
jgi:hypothetical protein